MDDLIDGSAPIAIWLFDNDLSRLFSFSKFVLWCKITGVKDL